MDKCVILCSNDVVIKSSLVVGDIVMFVRDLIR